MIFYFRLPRQNALIRFFDVAPFERVGFKEKSCGFVGNMVKSGSIQAVERNNWGDG